MNRVVLLIAVCMGVSPPAAAQTRALDAYLRSDSLRKLAEELANERPADRDAMDIRGLLPLRNSNAFVEFVAANGAPGFRDMLRAIDSLRLNKMIASAPGVSATSLVSRVAVPAVLGAAVEYGAILQQTSGTTTTLRGNVLGITRLLFGSEQFPYCAQIELARCGGAVRRLRTLSGSVAFEAVRGSGRTAAGDSPDAVPSPGDLVGDDYRVTAWSARWDVTPSNNLDDPKFIRAWQEAIEKLRGDPAAAALSEAVVATFDEAVAGENGTYRRWMAETTTLLRDASTAAAFYNVLEGRLVLLVNRMALTDDNFSLNLRALNRAYANYFEVRDALIREAQVHKLSVEYTGQRPQDQPVTSNLRLIYSHQPTAAPAIVTVNGAVRWYHDLPAGPSTSTLRDIQVAAQVDRRLGDIPRLGQTVLTFAIYYQWMKDDALVHLASSSDAPGGSGSFPLPGTKGHIAVLQGKWSIPLSDVIKVPISMTWATRHELIKENDVRAQVGLTLDLDSLFQ